MAKRDEITKAILAVIAVAGIVTIAAVAPGIVNVIARELKNKEYTRRKVQRSFVGLERSKLIGITKEGDKMVVKLTKKGKDKLLKFKFDEMKIKPLKHWDRNWRIIIFDVPQDFHNNRTAFTKKLKELGLKSLQKSVWICPYPCENEIDFLKEIYEIGRFVRVITAEHIDIQNDLIKKFSLT